VRRSSDAPVGASLGKKKRLDREPCQRSLCSGEIWDFLEICHLKSITQGGDEVTPTSNSAALIEQARAILDRLRSRLKASDDEGKLDRLTSILDELEIRSCNDSSDAETGYFELTVGIVHLLLEIARFLQI